MTYKIAFFDIDGTLVNEVKEIPQDTVDAIRELQATGVEAVIATGRAPYFFAPIAEKLGIDSFVSLNGAYVVYKGKPIFHNPIPRENLEALVGHADKNGHSLVFEGSSAFYSNTEDHPHMLDSVRSLRVDLPGYDPDFWKKEDVYQAFLHCAAEEEHLYEGAVPNLRLIRWHKSAMDVLTSDGSKALGIEALLKLVGIAPEEAVAFGDGLNDKEMLQAVGLGIAMGNSHEELKPYADYITSHVDEGGIRKGLQYAGLIK
ncbi:Cof-type HAD-IIB family hydrolase [Paenibacillus radicis (ex Gao et al. 2016)]|uniref:Phosphatase n=1 Tax=Paenibacillus radicis (ex Gao et al. 2016) TaxID=1737354 RepID=A0A917LTZ9_9BACL|nr:Cof-type HAD-IIB family hydrolase [Paenibacillus radicis (ex Gao et al. 2016)]GGG55302.1 phosphatase [Paenibacillus radicis (ex Gao et al. 2016)]